MTTTKTANSIFKNALPLSFLIFFVMISFRHTQLLASESLTPSSVYSEVVQIEKELLTIKRFFNINRKEELKEAITTELTPRHAWQKTYELMVKTNILRRANGLPIIEPVYMEPVLNVNPILTYEQTQRVLTELRIIKFRLGILEMITPPETFSKKTPMDVFNKLRHVSSLFDVINGSEFTPSYVYGEAMRIYQDVNVIIRLLGLTDTTIPPEKIVTATPREAMITALHLLEKISSLESGVGIEGVDASVFYLDNPLPEDVFEMTLILMAELQVIKASLGLRHDVTQAARYYTQKTPADVNQLLGWVLLKINLINTLR